MGACLVLFVKTGVLICVHVQIRRDEPIARGEAVAVFILDIEFEGPDVGELENRQIRQFGPLHRAIGQLTVLKDIKSSSECHATALWANKSTRLGQIMVI